MTTNQFHLTALFSLCLLLFFQPAYSQSDTTDCDPSVLYFESGKTDLSPCSIKALDGVLTFLVYYPYRGIKLEGHCDSREFPVNNFKLSLRRAEAAKSYLVAKGISPCRIQTEGRGSTSPEVPEKIEGKYNPQNMAFNRRVRFYVTGEMVYEDISSFYMSAASLDVSFRRDSVSLDTYELEKLKLLDKITPQLSKADKYVKIEITIDRETNMDKCKAYFDERMRAQRSGCLAPTTPPEVTAHTIYCDSLEAYDYQLLHRREKFIENYLQSLGINKERIIFNWGLSQAQVPYMHIRIRRYKCL